MENGRGRGGRCAPVQLEQSHARLDSPARDGEQHQVLLGVTGSGKTFTMAKVIERSAARAGAGAQQDPGRAALSRIQDLLPRNAVEYFVSYYDYYQPEAYIPSSDVYIEKEATINDELDKLRLSATRSLFERRDCVIVASVSCIYGLGSPEAYYGMLLMLEKGQKISRNQITSRWWIFSTTATTAISARHVPRARRRDRSLPTYDDYAYRIEMWGDEVEAFRRSIRCSAR
jgi:excinuclease ABC subunit B